MKLDLKSTANRTIIDFKKYGFSHVRLLGKYNYTKAQNILEDHIHAEMIEICYCDKGSQIFSVDNENYVVKGGDIFIHFPNEAHSTGGHNEEKGCLYWILIKVPDKKNVLTAKRLKDLETLCSQIIAAGKRHFRGNKEIKRLLENIIKASKVQEDQIIKHIRLKVFIHHLLLETINCIHESTRVTDNYRLNMVLRYIDENLDQSLTIESLAKVINLSESRFKGLFKELTGFTPGDYVQRKRIEKAIGMIENDPQISFTKVAYELGFSSPQYFSTVIKKYLGKSPISLRN